MPSKNVTDDDIVNLILTDENNLEDDLCSDDEGSEDETKEITASEHEDDNDYEGEGGSNDLDGSDVTGSGGNEIIIRGTNCYEWPVNEPKGMVQPPGRDVVVIQTGNKCEARNSTTPTEAYSLLYIELYFRRTQIYTNEPSFIQRA
jgi:hypothetical protein